MDTLEHPEYNEFWQNNLQGIDDLSRNLEKYFLSLEKKYTDFDSIYSEITNRVDLLSSIYSSYNNLKGRDYLLKLKALLNDYKKRYTVDGIDFNTIHYLYNKINALRQESFENFPAFLHDYSYGTEIKKNTDKYADFLSKEIKARYKWITFKRNGSWFITRYDMIDLVRSGEAELMHSDSDIIIRYNKEMIKIIDVFSRFSAGDREKINYYNIVHFRNEVKAFAAAELGKKILSGTDFISPQLIPFQKTRISPGKIRIFGKNHIFL